MRFSPAEHRIWEAILKEHRKNREQQVCQLFLDGVEELGIDERSIPDLDNVNRVLESRSGFRGVFVRGLEDARSFFRLLAERHFPVGNFIRSGEDLSYTPAPDVVHDLYGHLPFFVNKDYGDFCAEIGRAAVRYEERLDVLRQFERFFWFTIEFGLLKTSQGARVFGAGIASSIGECAYALGGTPAVEPFDVDAIRTREFRIDVMQPALFLLESPDQLYGSLGDLCARAERDARGGRAS